MVNVLYYFIIRKDDSAILKHMAIRMIYVPSVLSFVRYQMTPTMAPSMKIMFSKLRMRSLFISGR